MRFEILGKPIPLARPRFWIKNGRFGVRDAQKSAKDKVRGSIKKAIGEALNSEIKAIAIAAARLAAASFFAVDFEFIFAPSQQMKKKKKCKSLIDNELQIFEYYKIRPDIDNLIKFYLDCGSGIIWRDDDCIVNISAVKVYGPTAKTVMYIYAHSGDEDE